MVRKPGQDVGERELQQHARDYVDKGLLPKQVVVLSVKFVDAIEKTSVGKVNKLALRKKHLG